MAMIADEGILQITTWDRGATKRACSTSQWASNDEKKNHEVLKDAYEKWGILGTSQCPVYHMSLGTNSKKCF